MNAAEEHDQDGETMSRCLKEDLTHSFEVVLKDLPEVLLYIKRLNEHIKKQQCTLVKLFEKLKEYKQSSSLNLKNGSVLRDVSTQTDTQNEQLADNIPEQTVEANAEDQLSEWASSSHTKSAISLADEVKKVAESAMQQTGFVYEETSGMYYDYNTGYYYNAEMGLYYDGNSGTYLYYNERTKSYEYHSHAATPVQLIPDQQMVQMVQMAQPATPFVLTSKSAQIPFSSTVDFKMKSFNSEPEVSHKTSRSEIEVSKKSFGSEKEGKTKPVSVVKERKAKPVTSEKELKKMSNSLEKDVKKKEKKSSSSDKEERKKSKSFDKASKKKSKSTPSTIPDPLETKETELQMTGSNPMAPVNPEEMLGLHESGDELENPKESKHEHKRKSKHKKHKSKKKKKKRHRSHSRSEDSMEEGECSLSSASDPENIVSLAKKIRAEEIEDFASQEHPPPIEHNNDATALDIEEPWKKLRRLSDDASEAWPPCMRIIVENTEVRNLNVGNLFIVTCKGGTLGREKFHAVCIPDINISKHHGIFTFEESSGKYFFTDYGSRNGTYVNKQRLSSAKQESDPCEIPHGTVITLGSTSLLCHIHPGRETCEECEPGVVASRKAEDYEPEPIPSQIGVSKSEKRMQELRRLRKRFGIGSSETKAELAPGYEDRAEIRRVTVGSHNEHAKTEMASTTESIRSTNKGFKMLSKMGWKEGESLGRDGTGLTEPVLVTQRAEKAGLGADNAFTPDGPRPIKQRADRWQRARERYGQLPDTVDGGDPDPGE